jgi:hypothetical protein
MWDPTTLAKSQPYQPSRSTTPAPSLSEGLILSAAKDLSIVPPQVPTPPPPGAPHLDSEMWDSTNAPTPTALPFASSYSKAAPFTCRPITASPISLRRPHPDPERSEGEGPQYCPPTGANAPPPTHVNPLHPKKITKPASTLAISPLPTWPTCSLNPLQ